MKVPANPYRKALASQDNHREETKAVKKAIADAGIDAKVTHGKGTAWGWLHINIGSPKLRGGFKLAPFDHQYTDEEDALHKKVLKIVQSLL